MKNTTLHFLDRGYPTDLLHEAAIQAMRLNRDTLLHLSAPPIATSTDRSIMVTTFHPEDDSLRHVTKNWPVLGKSHSTLSVFHRKPMPAYRRPPNLKNFFVWADCEIKPTHKQGTGLLPLPQTLSHQPAWAQNKPSPNFSPNVKSLTAHPSLI